MVYRLNVEEFLKRARDWGMVIEVIEHIVTTYQDSTFEVKDYGFKSGEYRIRNLDGFCIAENELIEVPMLEEEK